MSAPTATRPRESVLTGWRRWFNPLRWLLLAIPAAMGLKVSGIGGVWMFLVAAVGIVPLAGLIGQATEALANRAGAGISGLLNATFGNAAELIIAIVILVRGPELYPVVKATLTGSIIGNLLLVLGAAALAGGLRRREQRFNRTAAGVGTTLLAIAAAGLLMPTLFFYLHNTANPQPADTLRVENLSEEIAAILIITYILSLVFSLRTHAFLYGSPDRAREKETRPEEPGWSLWAAIAILGAATVAVAFLSEWLVGAIEPAAHSLGMNGIFIGVVVVAIVGNAAEHFSAVQMAWENRMDVAVHIAVSSSTQIALFVAPLLVFISLLMGHDHPLDLHFSRLEVIAVMLSVGVVSLVAHDGKSNWLEGAMLLALYLILAMTFYNLPTTE